MEERAKRWVSRLDVELELDKIYGNADSFVELRLTRSEATELRVLLDTLVELLEEERRYAEEEEDDD